MNYLIGFLIFGLIAVILIQVSKISEIAGKLRGEEESELQKNNATAFWLVVFMIAFLVACVASAYYYKNVMLGYGPLESVSAHGGGIDGLFNTTLVITGIVFVLTQVLLFWYAYKYRSAKGNKAQFLAHDGKLELIWTAIPAVVMAFLVAKGLVVWNDTMTDLDPTESFLEIEATGYQFAWDIRFPGADGRIGNKDFRLINMANNSLGIDFTDEQSLDDVVLGGSDKIVLPVDTTVRVIITAKDVLHNFYLPHFRVKMDAVPGLPTYFIFKPIKTTAQMRQELKKWPEWNVPFDAAEPDGPKRYEKFDYELACSELCGKGHYSMRRIVEVVSKEEYAIWSAEQKSFYATTIRGTDQDPNKGKLLLPSEIKSREKELRSEMKKAMDAPDSSAIADRTVRFKNLFYKTGSADMEKESYYEIDYAAEILKLYPNMKVEIAGHTDNVGDAASNKVLSSQRAIAVTNRLIEKGIAPTRLKNTGYGDAEPAETNDTEDGRAANRRTELRVISKN